MANIIISGAGEVGRYTAEVLERQNDGVTLIDVDEQQLRSVENSLEGRLIHGSACHADVLEKADIENCDAFLAATSLDEVNLTTCAIAKKLGARKVIARVHSRKYMESTLLDYAETFSIDHLICPEQLTSHAICAKLQTPGVNAIQSFARNEIELHHYIIKKDCDRIAKPLKYLGLPIGSRFASIRRGDEAFYPIATSVLMPDDVVSIIGPTSSFGKIDHLFGDKHIRKVDVVIVGASSVCEWILAGIDQSSARIKLFETDLPKAESFAARYPFITVINDNPLDEKVFEEESIDRADAYVAVSDNEELNILGALHAKKLGVAMTIATINNSTYLKYLNGFGIDFTFSPRIEGAKELIRLLDTSPIKIRSKIEKGKVYVYEVQTTTKGKKTSERLKDLTFPQMSIVIAIERNGKVIAPTPNDTIEPNDNLFLIGPQNIERELARMFVGKI